MMKNTLYNAVHVTQQILEVIEKQGFLEDQFQKILHLMCQNNKSEYKGQN